MRQVDIRIEGDYVGEVPYWIPVIIPVIIANWGKTAAGIKALLENNGWIIERIADESGWTGNYIYRLTASVGDHYSDGQIQDQIVRDLAGFFTVVGASIVSDPYQVPAIYTGLPSIGNFDGGTVYGGSGPANYGNTPGASNPAGQTGQTTQGGDFFGNLGLGAGISTPIALIGGLIAVVLLTRR